MAIGPWIPRLKADAGLDAGGLGIALFGFAAGLVSGTRLAGPLTRRFGARRVVPIAALLVGAAFVQIRRMNGDLMVFYAIYSLMALVGGIDLRRATQRPRYARPSQPDRTSRERITLDA